MKFAEKTKMIANDRVSTILLIILTFSIIIVSKDEVIDMLCTVISLIAVIADFIWSYFILPKKKNAAKISTVENIISIIDGMLFFLILLIRLIVPQILPSWTNTVLITILFGLLTFFALNNPGQVEENRVKSSFK